MLRKFFLALTVVVMSLGLATPISHASKVDTQTNSSVDWKSATDSAFVDMDNNSIDKKQMQIADELSNYFEVDVKGDIIFTADKETLIEMGISDNDAELMISAGEEFTQIQEENQLEGFVGIHIILGPLVKNASDVYCIIKVDSIATKM